MWKKIVVCILVLTFLLSMSVFAAQPRVVSITPTLRFSGETAYCSVDVFEGGADINVILTLYRGWSTIASWTGSGRHDVYVSGTAAVKDGLDYRLVASGTIDGVPFAAEVVGTC